LAKISATPITRWQRLPENSPIGKALVAAFEELEKSCDSESK